MKLLKSNKNKIDYEQLYHDSQQKLSWHIDALETKQMQCDTIESVAEKLKIENQILRDKISSIEKSMSDLPKLLGKTLGK
jgi:hypothetical protein